MRTTVLTTICAALFVALVLSYVSTGTRIAELEERVRVLDDNFVHLSIPLEDSKRDISGIYQELDRIRENAGSERSAPAASASASAIVSRPKPATNHEPRVTALAQDRGTENAEPYDYPGYGLDDRLNNFQGTFNDADPDEH